MKKYYWRTLKLFTQGLNEELSNYIEEKQQGEYPIPSSIFSQEEVDSYMGPLSENTLSHIKDIQEQIEVENAIDIVIINY